MNLNENFIQNKFGYCFYAIQNNDAIIFNLYVHPEYRRCGHANRLIQLVINEIRFYGYTDKIKIEAIPKENSIDLKTLIKFYNKYNLDVININT
jgi:ribosomal protein S18 acetylase RimI-like enzyme